MPCLIAIVRIPSNYAFVFLTIRRTTHRRGVSLARDAAHGGGCRSTEKYILSLAALMLNDGCSFAAPMDAVPRARIRDTHRDAQQPARVPTDTAIGIRQMTSPFQLHREPSGWPAWWVVVGGAYVLLMCVFAGIGLGTLIASRGPLLSIVAESGDDFRGQSSVRQSTQFETGSVKVSARPLNSMYEQCTATSWTDQANFKLFCRICACVHACYPQ